MIGDQRLLFSGLHLHHSPLVVGVESGEDAAVGAEVRVAHVRLLDGAGQVERERAEVVSGHGASIARNRRSGEWRSRQYGAAAIAAVGVAREVVGDVAQRVGQLAASEMQHFWSGAMS